MATKYSTKLHHLAEAGDVAGAERLLAQGADPNVLTFGMTPLMRAVQRKQFGVAVLLLDHGADQSIRHRGMTPLHAAATLGPAAMVEALLDAGVDIEARDDQKATPLIRAARAGRIDVARALLDRGARVDVGDWLGWTPLYSAVASGGPDLVRLLLERGADPHRRLDSRIRRVVDRSLLALALHRVDVLTQAAPEGLEDRARLAAARAIVQMLLDAGATE